MNIPHKCPACDGYGWRPDPDSMFYAPPMPMRVPCPSCNGAGIVWELRLALIATYHDDYHSPSCACWRCRMRTATSGPAYSGWPMSTATGNNPA